MMNKKFMGGIALVVSLAACTSTEHKEEAVKADILITNRDSTVNPADDFFEYANGAWLKANPIPGDETGWGIGNMVQKELYDRLKKINEDAVAKADKKGTGQQIGDFWYSGMDTVSIEKEGINPLKPELDKINALKDAKELMQYAAEGHAKGIGYFFDEGVSQDAKSSDIMAYYMTQGGLGLPNRDYYFNTDERSVKIRNAYPEYIANVLILTGIAPDVAKAKAANIMAIEMKLAQASRKLEDLRDPYKNYNKMAISQLKNVSPTIDWSAVLNKIGVHSVDTVIIGQPEFYKQLDKVVATEDLQNLKDYMSFHLVRSVGAYMSKSFVDVNFNFYNKMIRGAQELKPRWKRVLDAEEAAMGEALGQLFAKEFFDAKAKQRYEEMVENVRKAYKKRMEKLDWMTDSTKKKALSKLAGITKKVGYPDKWKDFSSLKIDRGPFVLNILRANAFWNNYQLDKLGKPVDRNEWDMTPQTYNAYYNPSNNEIVLPAGIFTVPGYRDEELDDAVVYGYAGASTIGHEITHGFDDEGRQFDEKGNLKNWWSSTDEAQFNKRAEVLVQQFNKMVPVDTLHINGRATLGENLADLGGILIALDAFKETEAYRKGGTIHGLTQTQRFFMGYALGWLHHMRKEELAQRVHTDVHSPAKFRVNGPFPNVPDFYEAFKIAPGSPMYLPDSARVRLW